VFFIGFPGDGRTLRPYRGNSLVEVDWVGYTAIAVASGVSNTDCHRNLRARSERRHRIAPDSAPDWALGGCSGAPALTLVDHNQIYSWRLAGTIYESGAGILKIARADCIRTDGSIEPHPDPMAYIALRERNQAARRSGLDDSEAG